MSLRQLARAICISHTGSRSTSRLSAYHTIGAGADDSGKYSEKKDVDLFEIDTVGDVEGMSHLHIFQ